MWLFEEINYDFLFGVILKSKEEVLKIVFVFQDACEFVLNRECNFMKGGTQAKSMANGTYA